MHEILSVEHLALNFGGIRALNNVSSAAAEGEITATMKIKRRSISDKYAEVIEAMYGTRTPA